MSPEVLQSIIEKKRLTEFFILLPKMALVGLFVVLVSSWGLNGLVPDSYLYTGVLFALLILLACFFLFFLFRYFESLIFKNMPKWQLLILFSSFICGSIWGIACAMLLDITEQAYQPYIILTLVFLLSSYFPALVHYYRSFCVYAVSLVIPTIYVLTIAGLAKEQQLAFLLLAYIVLMLAFARWFNHREVERFRLQTELYEQNEKVKEANESKSRFLASASHDLRQPLQALGFYLVMLSDYLREPHKKTLFDKSLKAYWALESLLNQLLNISKLNANLVEVVNTNFSIRELFEKLRNDYELRAMDRGLIIKFDTKDYYLFSDVVSVERILRNLLENALRYTKEGSITARCKLLGNELVLEVIDTGIGIDAMHLDKIFSEFYQVKNPERDRNKGFGLGLYAVQRLAHLLGSKIGVISTLGEGSVFSIALPIGQRTTNIQKDITHYPLLENILTDKVVLLVDDDDVVLDSMSRLFMNWGLQVLTATSFADGVSLLTQEEIIPDIMVVDYRLPNHFTGVQLVKEINLLAKSRVPAIILTGDTGSESLKDINQSGLAFMHKPAAPNKLKSRMRKLLLV